MVRIASDQAYNYRFLLPSLEAINTSHFDFMEAPLKQVRKKRNLSQPSAGPWYEQHQSYLRIIRRDDRNVFGLHPSVNQFGDVQCSKQGLGFITL